MTQDKTMKRDWLIGLGYILEVFGSILMIFTGIILSITITNIGLLIFFWTYVVYLIASLILYGKKNRDFNKRHSEPDELLKLRMNHALATTIPIISIGISILFVFTLKENWIIFLLGLLMIGYGFFYLITGYLLRYREISDREIAKEIVRLEKLKNKKN